MDLTNKKIIIDTDIGDDIDDAYALLYLYQHLKENIIGVTTVFKNTIERAKITKNLLRYANSNIKVYAGESKPIKEPIKFLSFETPSDTLHITQYLLDMENEVIDGDNAVDFICESIKKYNKDLIILAIGPLTNIAKAYLKDKDTFNTLGKLIIMGGTFDYEYAEWNFRCDPEAANITLQSNVETYLVGHDLTKLSQIPIDYLNELYSYSNPSIKRLMELSNLYENMHNPRRIPILHDPLCSSILFGDFVTFEDMKVNLEVDAPKRAITTFPDDGKLCHVGVKADYQQFFKHLMNTFKTIEKGGTPNV